jgi:2-C-methyl-D-erythritol 4-phosphate cytidylyltransferase
MGADLPKQYLSLCGATVLEHSLGALLDCEQIQAVVVSLHPDDPRPQHMACFEDTRVMSVPGGRERSDSVLAGLQALEQSAADLDWVLVHDAARPCVAAADIRALISRVLGSGTGGILAEPVVDTVKQAGVDGLVSRTLDREGLWRAQTPQMFRLGQLRRALLEARERGLTVTDESAAMELAGHKVQLVTATSPNLKVTVPADLALAAWLLGHPVGHS